MANTNLKNYFKYEIAFRRRIKRLRRKERIRRGRNLQLLNIKKYKIKHGTYEGRFRQTKFGRNNGSGKVRWALPKNISFLKTVNKLFTEKKFSTKVDNGHLVVPECFSLIESYEESFEFLNKLYTVLLYGNIEHLILDYKNCKRIDVDASLCMDVILGDFIKYLNGCHKRGWDVKPFDILPINFQNDQVRKVLYSIGAFRNFKKQEIHYDDVIALPIMINSQLDPEQGEKSEVQATKIVEYIKECLKLMNRELSIESQSEFYKVLGEVMTNADQHATLPNRYAIGFFQETHKEDQHYGIFNFTIMNFGRTIYQTFKSEDCENKKIVDQMRTLSEEYTKSKLFIPASFEEET
jgi:hypothetical protein